MFLQCTYLLIRDFPIALMKILKEDSGLFDSAMHSNSESDIKADYVSNAKFSFDASKELKLIISKSLKGAKNNFLKRDFHTFCNDMKHSIVSLCNVLIKAIFCSAVVKDLLQ